MTNQSSIDWIDDRKQIMLAELVAHWTWDDAFCLLEKQQEMIAEVNHPVYTIIHMQSPLIPAGLIRNMPRVMRYDDPKERLTILVGHHNLLRKTIDFVNRLYRLDSVFVKTRYMATVEEALRFIEEDIAQNASELNHA